MNRTYIIVKNTERYGGVAPHLPNRMVCECTKEQAIALAEQLTNREAGCDYAFFVIDGNGEEVEY